MSPRKSSVQASVKAQSRREELRRQQLAEAARQRQHRLQRIGAAVAAAVLVAVLATVWFTRDKPGELTAANTPPHANADNSGIMVNPGKAKEGAPQVVLYLDYQCPICKAVETNVGANLLSLAQKGRISLEYRTRTFMDTNLLNSASTRAAIGAACSDWAGVYAQYHDAVYARQAAEEVKGSEGYSDQLLRVDIPSQLGVAGDKLTTFQQCYDQRTSEPFVKTVDDKASRAGYNATPTILVNGHQLEYYDAANKKLLDWAGGGQSDDTVLGAITAVA